MQSVHAVASATMVTVHRAVDQRNNVIGFTQYHNEFMNMYARNKTNKSWLRQQVAKLGQCSTWYKMEASRLMKEQSTNKL